MTNYNEVLFFSHYSNDGNGMIYSTYNQKAFTSLTKGVRLLKKIGIMNTGIPQVKASVYYDGRYYYCAYVEESFCMLSDKIKVNLYKINFYKKKPYLITGN